MENSTFSVNIELTNDDLFEIKKTIMDLIKKKAEDSTVSYYRPEKKKTDEGITVGKGCHVGDPEPKKINELLDIIKDVKKSEDDMKSQVMITIPMPMWQ